MRYRLTIDARPRADVWCETLEDVVRELSRCPIEAYVVKIAGRDVEQYRKHFSLYRVSG